MMAEVSEIKALRKRNGLTQKQLANASGVSQSLIAKLESGLIDASYSKVSRILEALAGFGKEKEAKASEIASSRIISVSKSQKVSEAIAVMKRHGISQLPVKDKGSIIGLVSEADIIEGLHKGKDVSKLKVEELMQDAPPTVPRETPLSAITELLRVSQIIIVADKGKPKGVITKADILKGLGKR